MGLIKGKAQLASPGVLPADSSSQCECELLAPLARAMWACPHSKELCFSAPAAPPQPAGLSGEC